MLSTGQSMIGALIDNRTLLTVLEDIPDLADRAVPIGRDGMSSSYQYVVSNPAFTILQENQMIYDALLAFLKADWKLVCQLHGTKPRGIFRRLLSQVGIRSLYIDMEETERLTRERDELFDKYEMMRRLVCWDNQLLLRYKS